MQALDGALDDFIVTRKRRRRAETLIEQRLDGVSAEVVKVRAQMPNILQWQRERPGQQLEEGAGTAGKHPHGAGAGADGAAHRRRRRAGPSGSARERDAQHPEEERSRRPPPRLHDAGVQPRIEYHGLKSINADVTASAIELKVLIEQMREQIRTSSDPAPHAIKPAPLYG